MHSISKVASVSAEQSAFMVRVGSFRGGGRGVVLMLVQWWWCAGRGGYWALVTMRQDSIYLPLPVSALLDPGPGFLQRRARNVVLGAPRQQRACSRAMNSALS